MSTAIVYPRVAALCARRKEIETRLKALEKKRRRTARDGVEITALRDEIRDMRHTANRMRPRTEGELRELENAGFLEPAMTTLGEGDASFDLMTSEQNLAPLNFDENHWKEAVEHWDDNECWARDDYGPESMP